MVRPREPGSSFMVELRRALDRLMRHRAVRWAALGVALSWGGLAYGLHRYGADRRPDEGEWDAIVVLGCRVYADGRPSNALASRVRMAVALFREGRAPVIVLTGGRGAEGPPEAEVAAALAEQLGVPRSALVVENRSSSTELNARYAFEMVEGRRVLLVTDAYHVLRSERVFARYFDEVHGVGTVNPRVWPRVRGALREVVAVVVYAVQGRL